MRIVHCVDEWLPLTCNWLYSQLRFLPSTIETSIVCARTSHLNEFRIPNSAIYCVSERMHMWGLLLQRLKRRLCWTYAFRTHLHVLGQVMSTVKPHIVHSHFGHIGWANARLTTRKNVKHIVSFYGLDVNYLPRMDPRFLKRYRSMGNSVDKVLCEGPHMAGCIARLGIPDDKIEVYRLGVELDRIRFAPRRWARGDRTRFLIAGTFREKKGIPYAIAALGMYHKIDPNIEVTIIGDGADDIPREREGKRQVVAAIAESGLEKKVRLLGFQPHDVLLQEAYEHHVFVSPSVTAVDGDTEGGAPVSIIEMAASGMPVVSTTHCDIPFVLSEKNRPYLVPERDAPALADAINRLRQSDWSDIVAANRRYVEQELDARKQSAKLAEIYVGLLD